MSKSLSLLNHCLEIAVIKCDAFKCTVESSVDADGLQAIDVWYKHGWRVKKGECLCPKHAKEKQVKKK